MEHVISGDVVGVRIGRVVVVREDEPVGLAAQAVVEGLGQLGPFALDDPAFFVIPRQRLEVVVDPPPRFVPGSG